MIDYEYIESTFNLYGLRADVSRFSYCRNILTEEIDSSSDGSTVPSEWESPMCADLYGRIHARFINTDAGQQTMETKYTNGDFGQCPRFACNGQNVLPVGMSDIPGESEVKVYCPRCNGVFETSLSHADGAFFGRTFPHFFLLVRTKLVPEMQDKRTALEPYEPTLFGYKISPESKYWNFGDRGGGGGGAGGGKSGNGSKSSAKKPAKPPSKAAAAAGAEKEQVKASEMDVADDNAAESKAADETAGGAK